MSEIKNNKSVDPNFKGEAGVGVKKVGLYFFTSKTYMVLTVSRYLIGLCVRCDSSTPKSQKCAFLKKLVICN